MNDRVVKIKKNVSIDSCNTNKIIIFVNFFFHWQMIKKNNELQQIIMIVTFQLKTWNCQFRYVEILFEEISNYELWRTTSTDIRIFTTSNETTEIIKKNKIWMCWSSRERKTLNVHRITMNRPKFWISCVDCFVNEKILNVHRITMNEIKILNLKCWLFFEKKIFNFMK